MNILKNILIMLLLAGSFSIPVLQAENLKILSYNIYKGMLLDKSEGKSDFAAWVDSLTPDIVALQEVNGFTQKSLEELARTYGHPYAVLLKEEGYPVALTSKYPITNIRKVVDNMHHGFIQAQILDFNIIVTHFSPHKYWKRSEEIDLILSTVKNSNPHGKWIIMGDLNTYSPQDSLKYQDGLLRERIRALELKYQSHENLKNGNIDYSVIQKIVDFGFYDALKLNNKAFILTVPTRSVEHSYLKEQAEFRIDYIFVSKSVKKNVLNCTVIKDDFTNYKSDHYPVLIEIKNLKIQKTN